MKLTGDDELSRLVDQLRVNGIFWRCGSAGRQGIWCCLSPWGTRGAKTHNPAPRWFGYGATALEATESAMRRMGQ